MPRIFLLIAFALFGIGTFFFTIPYRKSTIDPLAVVVLTCIALPFFIVGTYLLLVLVNHRIRIDDRHIYMNDFRGRMTAHAWEDLATAASTGASAILILTFKDGRRARISQYLWGMRTFVSTLERKTGHRLSQGDYPVIWWYRTKWPL